MYRFLFLHDHGRVESSLMSIDDSMPYPFIEVLENDPELRGRIHGSSLAREIARNVAICYRRFDRNGLTCEAARFQASAWMHTVLTQEWLLAEMGAIAKFAEIDLLDVAILNLRFEIGFPLMARRAMRGAIEDTETDGCTSFGLLPENSADGHMKLGQTLDGISAIAGNLAIIKSARRGGLTVLGLHEAGSVAPSVGLNSSGIGVAYNSLISLGCENPPFGLPFRLRVLAILEAKTFANALGAALIRPRPTATHLLVGHRDGELVGLELTQENAAYIYPECGVLTHANHFEHMPGTVSLFERLLPDSIFRSNRMRRLFGSRTGSIDDQFVEAVLQDHFSFPFSICHHGDERLPPDRRAATLAGVILDLTSHTLAASNGPPCQQHFERFSLKE
jgi:isopenicillin-N N-acyltransferase-like protein